MAAISDHVVSYASQIIGRDKKEFFDTGYLRLEDPVALDQYCLRD